MRCPFFKQLRNGLGYAESAGTASTLRKRNYKLDPVFMHRCDFGANPTATVAMGSGVEGIEANARSFRHYSILVPFGHVLVKEDAHQHRLCYSW